MTKEKEAHTHINDFMQLHNTIMKSVEKYMIEVGGTKWNYIQII